MPLFEYACRNCDHEFEALVRASETPTCPACRSTALERQLSVFAARTQGSSSSGDSSFADRASAGGCGRCGDPRGPGACSMN